LFDAIVERFALLADIPAQRARGRAEALLQLQQGHGRASLHPVARDAYTTERGLEEQCLSPEEYQAALDEELEQAQLPAANGCVDRGRLACALQRSGVFACLQGDHELAQRSFECAIACVGRGPHDHEQLGLLLHWLAFVLALRGEHAVACALYERAASEWLLGGPDGVVDGTRVGLCLQGVADCLCELAQPARAVDYYQRALAQLERGGSSQALDEEALRVVRSARDQCLAKTRSAGHA
jgi:tetratricopeptide (TPR) repeat protein